MGPQNIPAMSHTDESTPNVKQAVPFLTVTDMDKSLTFYTAGLGFEVKMKWEPRGRIEWCWLELGHAALMLQEYRNPPPEKLGEGVSVVFMCQDALKLYAEFVSNGLTPDEPVVGNTLWVVGLKDPDGYSLVFESPTEVPEETTYSEWIKTAGKK